VVTPAPTFVAAVVVDVFGAAGVVVEAARVGSE
jgi:hypothetical protein